MINFYRRFVAHCAAFFSHSPQPHPKGARGPKVVFNEHRATFNKLKVLFSQVAPDSALSLMADAATVAAGALKQVCYLAEATR